jgi:hypothetical protein
MAKLLRHTKSGTKEVQRLLCHHLDQALQALQGDQPLSDEAVHSVRKQLKTGRADLRLLRKALGSQTYAYENTVLRDVARPLTTVRDARTCMDTLDALVEHSGVQGLGLDLERVRRALQEAYGVVRGAQASVCGYAPHTRHCTSACHGSILHRIKASYGRAGAIFAGDGGRSDRGWRPLHGDVRHSARVWVASEALPSP